MQKTKRVGLPIILSILSMRTGRFGMSETKVKGPVYIYLVRGQKDHLHIATSLDVEKTLSEINAGEGPTSVRAYAPVELVYVRRFTGYSEARPVLMALKSYRRERKDRLVAAFLAEWTGSIEQGCLVSEKIGYPPVK